MEGFDFADLRLDVAFRYVTVSKRPFDANIVPGVCVLNSTSRPRHSKWIVSWRSSVEDIGIVMLGVSMGVPVRFHTITA